jgi:hypothetical protein
MEEAAAQTRLDTSPDNMPEGKPEELVANVPVKQLLHIFDAILAIKSDVDEILIVTDCILLRHRLS